MDTDTLTAAQTAGREAGTAHGSWVIDGNTTEETALRILRGYEDGDPEIMDLAPYPLSGEWAGESIPELSADLGLDPEDAEIADTFCEAYEDAFWTEVLRSARASLHGES